MARLVVESFPLKSLLLGAKAVDGLGLLVVSFLVYLKALDRPRLVTCGLFALRSPRLFRRPGSCRCALPARLI